MVGLLTSGKSGNIIDLVKQVYKNISTGEEKEFSF